MRFTWKIHKKRSEFNICGYILSILIPISGSLLAFSQAARSKEGDDAIFREQNTALFQKLTEVHHISAEETKAIQAIFAKTGYIGQGNPAITQHPMTPAQCQEKLKSKNVSYENAEHEKICGDRFMAPLYDPKTSTPGNARVCIDKFEFPNIPCEYPVVWVKADEAAQICNSMGKRMCDAHEWEGSCAGQLLEPDYDFSLTPKMNTGDGLRKMRLDHNARENKKGRQWSYGSEYRKGICAANSTKTEGCGGEGWKKCGSNTYPVGSFPDCKSALDVYDTNGNAAEHMNLPLKKEEMASTKGSPLGYTEMKGSWFIFDKYQAHEDSCRWRAPFWHGTKVMDPKSHHNYHLGFRCCKDVEPLTNGPAK
jgi:formylglycine-generating enzyme required for sulfatase activity